MAMFAQNKKKKSNCFHFGFTVSLFPCAYGLQMISAARRALLLVACRQLHMIRNFQSGDEGQDFGKVWQDDFSRSPGGCWGGLCGITRTAASVVHEKSSSRWGESSGARTPPEGKRGEGTEARFSHGLELVDALLRVALSDLAQRFVFVSARFHVLGVQHVVLRLLGFIPGLGQLWT